MSVQKHPKRILLVDDDQSILRLFKRILEKEGYTVDTAETGREATEKIEENCYDLSIIDVRLPDTSGVDLLAEIHTVHPDIVSIALTGFPRMEDGIKALENGADAYLVKPVKPEELLDLIKQKLRRPPPPRGTD